MTNRPNGILYTGVTTNLARRTWEHRESVIDGFTKTYALKRLVYVEEHATISGAILREKTMKHGIAPGKLGLFWSVIRVGPTFMGCWRDFTGENLMLLHDVGGRATPTSVRFAQPAFHHVMAVLDTAVHAAPHALAAGVALRVLPGRCARPVVDGRVEHGHDVRIGSSPAMTTEGTTEGGRHGGDFKVRHHVVDCLLAAAGKGT